MERIKQALERARAEREGQPRSQPAPAIQRKAPTGTEIHYDQTRNIEVPDSVARRERVVTAFPEGAFSEAYKILRTQVLQRLKNNDWNVLAVTSPGHGEGKTLTALNLAVSMAMEIDRTVLLIDANLRHPSLHTHLGLPEAPGLSDYLQNDTPLSELLVHPRGAGHLTVLPGGRPLPNSAEMLGSPKMMHLVEETKTRYPGRIVIFDLPPVLEAADALAFSPYVDAALLVVAEGVTSRADTERAVDLLRNTNVLGTVLNKAGGAC